MAETVDKTNKYKKILWVLFVTPFFLVALIFILISIGAFGFMPTFEDLENPNNNIASEIIAEDGVMLGTYYYQNRSFVDYDKISPNVINALIATEDVRFYKHSGIDIRGLARVFFKTIILQSNSGGGSTITQQLAKNLFPRDTSLYNNFLSKSASLAIAKFKEWQTAVKLERNYTKEEIITMYLNTVPFGGQAYGIKMAAKTYFNKSTDSLNIEEAAMLVGMLKAPTRYSPVQNPERALRRRNVVLSQLEKYDFINKRQCDSLKNLPLIVDYKAQDHTEGLATYFREYLRTTLTANKPQKKNYYDIEDYKRDSVEWCNNPLYGWCNKHVKPDGTTYNIYSDGLKIYTTINSVMQQYAEDAVYEHVGKYLQPAFFKEKKGRHDAPFASNLTADQRQQIMDQAVKRTERYRVLRNEGWSFEDIMKDFKKKHKMRVFTWNGERDTILSPLDSIRYYKFFLQTGLMSMDPHTGYVKAYVGGIDYKYFKYDHVTISKRQAGSTIKPFIYTLAMQEGYSPCDKVPNVPVTFILGDTIWSPKNSGRSDYEGKMVTLKWGLANSVNFISAWVMKQFNPPSVIDIMRKMGFTSYIAPYPSLVLGTSDVTLYEMTGAYGCYANKGIYVKPMFVTRIEDKTGNVLATFTQEKTEAISEQTAYLMVNLMEGVVNAGTACRLRYGYKFTGPIGGKTGTTQNHSDGWFMGFTPDLVTGVWVGGEDRAVHFDNIDMGQGANMALPVWAIYMDKVFKNKSLRCNSKSFERPYNFNVDIYCTDTDEKSLNEEDIRMMNE
ncbi:MAG TPA: transglycosylase domain-containing protein [Bacteroidales bacterium]|nr:transglycosylase domain-containing protein [Bacteroidales bacterium]